MAIKILVHGHKVRYIIPERAFNKWDRVSLQLSNDPSKGN